MARFKVQCGQYGNNDILKLKLFGTSLSGATFSWYSRLKPGSIADWPTMERLFRETYGTIELEVDLESLTQMSQQSMESRASFLQRFKIQQAKCDFLLPEQEAIKLVVRGLEHR